MTLTASRQFQLQYDSEHRGYRRAKLTDQLIYFHRRRAKRFFHFGADAVGFGFQRFCDRDG